MPLSSSRSGHRSLATRSVLICLVATALCVAPTTTASAAQLTETPLSREATKDAEGLAGEILASYRSASPKDRERRTLGSFSDSFYGTPLATELGVVYRVGKHSGYVLQADFAEDRNHTISPARVTQVRISERLHIPAEPLWRDLRVQSYAVLLEAAHHQPLETKRWPLYWNLTAEYEEDREVGFGTTNTGIDPATCDNPLPASALAAVDTQAKEGIRLARVHAPISQPQSLVSLFAPCYLR
jgi:hypothetical protein